MDRRPTIAELLATIENQQEQLARFETRFRDVVKAYKGLLKEKEALEASLRALSMSSSRPRTIKDDVSEEESEAEQSDQGVERAESDAEAGSADAVATLTSALTTVTEEKNRMEASFQADKKKLMSDYEASVLQSTQEKKKTEEAFKQSSSEVEELKYLLRQQQQEREAEQTDHVAMLRELQQLVAKERQGKDDLESRVQDLEEALSRAKESPDKYEVYERRLKALTDELQETRRKLKAADKSADRPSPMLLQLQKEMADLKARHAQALLVEQQRATDVEQRLRVTRGVDESRVATLEDRLSELSTAVGSYERMRTNDESTIHRLKERITQLSAENSDLIQQAKEGRLLDDQHHSHKEIELQDQISKLKDLLATADAKIEHQATSRNKSPDDGSKAQNYRFELEKLRNEFDQYKRKVQDATEKKRTDDTEKSGLQDLRRQRDSLSHDLADARSTFKDKEAAYRKEIEELIEERHQMQAKYKESISAAEMHYQERLAELQLSVQNARVRTKALLSDKEAELTEMRSRLLRRSTSYIEDIEPELRSPDDQKVMSYAQLLREATKAGPLQSRQGDTDAAVRQLLSLPSLGSKAEVALLHYVEQQSKREAEIKVMRQERFELEQSLRDAREKEERHADQLILLKEEIRKLERDRSRETANLEYLKNIVYRFMRSNSSSPGFHQMISAIATILRFSPKEVENVKKFHSSWWYST